MKKQNRGFTLVELMAVVVVLAVLALVTTPIVITILENSKKNVFKNSVEGLIRIVNLDQNKAGYEAENYAVKNGTVYNSQNKALGSGGGTKENGAIYIDDNGKISLVVENSKWCATKEQNKSSITIKDYDKNTCKISVSTVPAIKMLQTKNVAGNTEGLFTDDYGNIRYRGASPKNYVIFNNEVWRIIGIVDGKVKLIRDENVKELLWNSAKENEWVGSTTQVYLNGEYYNGLTETAKNQIDEHTYKLGGIPNTSDIYSKDSYTLERGTTVYAGRSTEWIGKIGLIYPSDYGYAVGSECTQKLFDYDNQTCLKNDWMYKSSYAWWGMTPYSGSSLYVSLVTDIGRANGYFAGNASKAVRPVLHLKSTVKITGGDGTSANPYTLK